MNQMKEPKERKYTLEEARKILASQAANASFDARGITGMRKMAKQSWEKPSAKRKAFAIIAKALSIHKIVRVRELNRAGFANCEGCAKRVSPIKRENIVPRDWNKPYDTALLCGNCLKKHESCPITDTTVDLITAAELLSTEPKIIVEKALGSSDA